jgi:hypothetical protein
MRGINSQTYQLNVLDWMVNMDICWHYRAHIQLWNSPTKPSQASVENPARKSKISSHMRGIGSQTYQLNLLDWMVKL